MMPLRLTKSYIAILGAVFIFFTTVQLFRHSSEPSSPTPAQSVGWREWMWPTELEDQSVVKGTPPKFSRPGSNGEGSIPKPEKTDQQKWEEMVPSNMAPPHAAPPPAIPPEDYLNTGPDPSSKSKPKSKEEKVAQKVVEKEKEKEKEQGKKEEEEGDEIEVPLMKEADCSSRTAAKVDALPALNTTFHVPDDMRYSPKGPDPSEVVIVTATDGKGHNGGIEDIIGQTAANRKSYCHHHGYNYHFVNISQYDLDDAHPVWKKIPAIVDAFNTFPKAQWVFFLDLDAIIMNPKQDLNSLVLSHAGMSKSLDFGAPYHGSEWSSLGGVNMPEMHDVKFEDLDMLVAQDHNGVNAGSFFLRRSKFTQWMLDMWADPFFMRMDWAGQEQDTLLHFIKHHKVFRQHLGLIKQRTANAYVQGNEAMKWQPGDLVVHFAGCWVDDACQAWWQEFWGKRGTLTTESY